MDPINLKPDELAYELFIRHVHLDSVRGKINQIMHLRELLNKEALGIEKYPEEQTGDTRNEINVCEQKLVELKPVTLKAISVGDVQMLSYTRTRIIHLYNRCKRIQTESNEDVEKQSFIINMSSKLIEEIDRKLDRKSPVNWSNSVGHVSTPNNELDDANKLDEAVGGIHDISLGTGDSMYPVNGQPITNANPLPPVTTNGGTTTTKEATTSTSVITESISSQQLYEHSIGRNNNFVSAKLPQPGCQPPPQRLITGTMQKTKEHTQKQPLFYKDMEWWSNHFQNQGYPNSQQTHGTFVSKPKSLQPENKNPPRKQHVTNTTELVQSKTKDVPQQYPGYDISSRDHEFEPQHTRFYNNDKNIVREVYRDQKIERRNQPDVDGFEHSRNPFGPKYHMEPQCDPEVDFDVEQRFQMGNARRTDRRNVNNLIRDEEKRFQMDRDRHMERRYEPHFENNENGRIPIYNDRQTGRRQQSYFEGNVRKSKPIYQWQINFSGEKGLSLNDFLDQVEMMAYSEGYRDRDLFESILHLLSGRAYAWYREIYRTLRSWEEFKRAIRQEFLPEDYEHMLRWEIDNRSQGKDESFSSYLTAMKRLFTCLEHPLSEREQLYAVRRGLQYSYAMNLATCEVNSLDQLNRLCKRIDHTRMMMDRQKYSVIPRSSLLEPDYSTPFNSSGPKISRNVHVCEHKEEEDFNVNLFQNKKRPPFPPSKREISTQTTTTINRSFGDKVICWNCKANGHSFRECTIPKSGLFCFKCGEKDTTLAKCTKCLNNIAENRTVELH